MVPVQITTQVFWLKSVLVFLARIAINIVHSRFWEFLHYNFCIEIYPIHVRTPAIVDFFATNNVGNIISVPHKSVQISIYEFFERIADVCSH